MAVQADLKRSASREKDLTVRAFVPSFLTIKARQIAESASGNINARHEAINSTSGSCVERTR